MCLLPLKNYRGETIDMASTIEKLWSKSLAPHTEFLEIPRILAVGCDRWGTDQCEPMFPCLLSSSLSFNRGRE